MPSSPNALPARIKRVAVFVGIVWAVALSFVALELVALAGFGLVLQTDAGRRRAVPQAVSESQTCTPNSPAGQSALANSDDGKAVSWVLGVTAGIRAQNARWGTYGTGAPAEAPPRWLLIARDRLAQAEAAVGEMSTAGRAATKLASPGTCSRPTASHDAANRSSQARFASSRARSASSSIGGSPRRACNSRSGSTFRMLV